MTHELIPVRGLAYANTLTIPSAVGPYDIQWGVPNISVGTFPIVQVSPTVWQLPKGKWWIEFYFQFHLHTGPWSMAWVDTANVPAGSMTQTYAYPLAQLAVNDWNDGFFGQMFSLAAPLQVKLRVLSTPIGLLFDQSSNVLIKNLVKS